ncbi:MAG: hypothetical protein LBU67_03070, partial [Oscillospiraceae bacterium]|nr:hypothetical protein [Oscillospiraceae bacterium]
MAMYFAKKRSAASRGNGRPRAGSAKKRRDTLVAYAFMLPALAVVLVFVIYPILYSLPLGLFNYTGMTAPKFVGLDNFRKA